jgi:putative zinc finger protein
MKCRDIALQLDDYLDRRLDAVQQQSIQEHLQSCDTCRRRHQHAVALQAALRALPAPAPRPGFVDQALSRASLAAAGGARHTRRARLGMALAACLVLGVMAFGVFLATRPTPMQTVALTLERPEILRLMFNSAESLSVATLSLTLPVNVELVGYGNLRELTWQTDLREGGNLLQLPLVARGTATGEFVARLSHGAASKTFRLRIEVNHPGKTSMSPAGPST